MPLTVVDALSGPSLLDALDKALHGGPAMAPVDPRLPAVERERIVATLRPDEPVDPDVAVVVATSGSTGAPKAVELTGAALLASAEASLARIGAASGDRWLCCVPASHVAGLQVLVRSIVLGTDPLIHDRFDPGAVANAEATHVSLVPTMLLRLLDAGVDVARFQRILLGGAGASPGLLDRARAAGARFTTTYGMTETCGGCVYDGRPLDGVEVALDEGGRIRIRGPVLARRYRGGERIDGGWFVTQDVGAWREDGRLRVLGRADEVIVTGGENVAPGLVAGLLADHPAVAEAAVIGRPDDEWGTRVVAVVVPADPERPPSLGDLRRFVLQRLAPAAAPRELVLVGALPLLANGKVDPKALLGRPPA